MKPNYAKKIPSSFYYMLLCLFIILLYLQDTRHFGKFSFLMWAEVQSDDLRWIWLGGATNEDWFSGEGASLEQQRLCHCRFTSRTPFTHHPLPRFFKHIENQGQSCFIICNPVLALVPFLLKQSFLCVHLISAISPSDLYSGHPVAFPSLLPSFISWWLS